MSLDEVPAAERELAREAIRAVFDRHPFTLERVLGGASGALAFRVTSRERSQLLRIERRGITLRNPHQYRCMAIAAEAGIAPPIRFLDDSSGVVVMDFIESRPLSQFPGGPAELVVALSELVRRLQSTPAFPDLYPYPVLIERMLAAICASGRFSAGLLDPHREAFARISSAYPFDPAACVSSHNDPNAQNVLFDGTRLWLVDWETAYRNDPLTDVAILVENFAPTPTLERTLLTTWHGGSPDEPLEARLHLMRLLARLYYAGLVLASSSHGIPETDDSLDCLAPDALTAAVSRGELALGTPAFMHALGKMFLAGFLEGARAPRSAAALEVLKRA